MSDDLGSVKLMVGLDLTGLSQPKLTYNSNLEEETNKLTTLDTRNPSILGITTWSDIINQGKQHIFSSVAETEHHL